jgi:hypothetical protein
VWRGARRGSSGRSSIERFARGEVMVQESSWADAIFRSFEPYSFEAFHREQLPLLVERHGHLVVADLVGAPPLAFRCNGTAFTWRPSGLGVEVQEGEAGAATVVELVEEAFSMHLHDLLTAYGAEASGRARLLHGDRAGWERWEPAIQSLRSGREIYGSTVWHTLRDRTGAPLDLRRTFSVDDDVEEMRHFFQVAGYVHVAAVFAPEEIECLGAEVERVRREVTPEDPATWWAVNTDGEQVLSRINYLAHRSKVLREMADDPRLPRYAGLASPDLQMCVDIQDGPMVFVKNSNIVKGQGDLDWHVDDALGGHPVYCPFIQAGIQLDRADAANGQLLLLAGSHRYARIPMSREIEATFPIVPLETEPGDLTIHSGDTLHSTPPPTRDGAGRRALYYKFAPPKTFDWIPPGFHYNDAIFGAKSQFRTATGTLAEFA